MNAVVEEVSKQYKVQVPWGGAVMKMLCNDEYKFWRRRWGADAAGSVLLGSSVMCSELFFIAKMSIFEVCDQSGESGEAHGDATDGRQDGGVFVGGKGPVS